MTDLRALLQFGQQMQGRLAAIQSELAQRTVTGSAGGGMVTVTADGRGQVREVHIDPSLLGGDVEMLEDLVVAAVAEVQKRAAELAQDEIKKVQSVLPFPLPFSL
ncbi:MAG TPA: YbaB/EbfC family nucleoid-associated protein [Gemmatimonadales bacterium]|nr:YbaB/EbfC family nucleoid-associated protein [Gemmatimonadales bacterium]